MENLYMHCVRLSVNVTFAQNATGMNHLETACTQLFHKSLDLG